jgi:MFS family permease
MINGRREEAQTILERFGDTEVESTLSGIHDSLRVKTHAVSETLWKKKYFIPIIGALALAAFNQFSGINALMYYAPKIFNMGGSTGDAALLQSIPMGVMMVMSTLIGLAIIDRLGRKSLLIIGSLGMAFFLVMVGMQFNRMEATDEIGASIMLWFLGYILFFGPSTGAVLWVFISEIFPNRVRSKGQAAGSFTVWVSAALVTQLFPVAAAADGIGPGNSFIFFAFCMLGQALFVWLLLPETKGVSLEELQKKMGID